MENKFYKDAVGVRIICSNIDDILYISGFNKTVFRNKNY